MDAGRAQGGGPRDLTEREPLLMGGHDGPDALLLGRAQAHSGETVKNRGSYVATRRQL